MALEFDGTWKSQKLPLRDGNVYAQKGAHLDIASDAGVSILYRGFGAPASSASWNWAVDQSVPATNLRQKGGDDRNLSLYFVFAPANEAAALRSASLTKLLRNNSVKALVYTYGGAESPNTAFQSPYGQGRASVVIKAPAGTGGGAENVNLNADYQAAYGEAPQILIGVAISADSDDTKSSIRARISNLNIN